MGNNKEILISRTFDASPERVWEAFTTPEQLVEWWGPEGFTNTFESFDLKVGGTWKFIMHGPDGTDYPNLITFEEVTPLHKLAYKHSGLEDKTFEPFQTEITFVGKEAGKTQVNLRMEFANTEEYEKQVKFGAVEGGNSTFKRLADFLVKN